VLVSLQLALAAGISNSLVSAPGLPAPSASWMAARSEQGFAGPTMVSHVPSKLGSGVSAVVFTTKVAANAGLVATARTVIVVANASPAWLLRLTFTLSHASGSEGRSLHH
jgi:hypothetical protein